MEVVHGDLKGLNILITPKLRACICDFGLSRVADTHVLPLTTSSRVNGGTIRWMAPELMIPGPRPTTRSDMYAYGCVCYEIFAQQRPFHDLSDGAVIVAVHVEKSIPSRPQSVPDAVWELMLLCWDQDPSKRTTATDASKQLTRLSKTTGRKLRNAPDWSLGTHTSTIWKHVKSPVLDVNLLANLQDKLIAREEEGRERVRKEENEKLSRENGERDRKRARQEIAPQERPRQKEFARERERERRQEETGQAQPREEEENCQKLDERLAKEEPTKQGPTFERGRSRTSNTKHRQRYPNAEALKEQLELARKRQREGKPARQMIPTTSQHPHPTSADEASAAIEQERAVLVALAWEEHDKWLVSEEQRRHDETRRKEQEARAKADELKRKEVYRGERVTEEEARRRQGEMRRVAAEEERRVEEAQMAELRQREEIARLEAEEELRRHEEEVARREAEEARLREIEGEREEAELRRQQEEEEKRCKEEAIEAGRLKEEIERTEEEERRRQEAEEARKGKESARKALEEERLRRMEEDKRRKDDLKEKRPEQEEKEAQHKSEEGETRAQAKAEWQQRQQLRLGAEYRRLRKEDNSRWSYSSRTSATTNTSASSATHSPTNSTSTSYAPSGYPTPLSAADWVRRQQEYAQAQQEKFREEQERHERERLARITEYMGRDGVRFLFTLHESLWTSLPALHELRWDSFPWPMLTKPSHPEEITLTAIGAYVHSPHNPDKDKKPEKDRIKDLIRRWHADRFETTLLPKVRELEKAKVKEGASNVFKRLNELLTKSRHEYFEVEWEE